MQVATHDSTLSLQLVNILVAKSLARIFAFLQTLTYQVREWLILADAGSICSVENRPSF